jgi:hypothetical protein
MAKTVVVKGDPIYKEAQAGGAINPGHLIKFSSGNVVVHDTAGGNAAPMFARENDIIGDAWSDAYASGDTVLYIVGRQGDEVRARVAAAASAITKGDPLVSAGDGTLKKGTEPQTIDVAATTTVSVYDDRVVAYAMEDVNNSGGSAEVPIIVEIA